MKTQTIARILALCFVALLVGCVSGTVQLEQVFPQPEPGKGLVYFYRRERKTPLSLCYDVEEHAKPIGAVKNGTYFFVQASPGPHTYTAYTEATGTFTPEVEAGHTYYIECGINLEVFTGRSEYHIADDAEAKVVLESLKYFIRNP